MVFRVDDAGNLIGFAGSDSASVTVDGRETVFADQPIGQLAWGPVAPDRRVPGGALVQAIVYGTGVVRIPDAGLPATVEVVAQGAVPGSRGATVPSERTGGAVVINVTPEAANRWLFIVPVG